MTPPIDEGTWQRWRIAWRRSRQLGRDFAEYLNQVGLLLTPARRREMLAAELRKVALELENESPGEILLDDGRYGYNALDMQRASVAWLRRRADQIEREG